MTTEVIKMDRVEDIKELTKLSALLDYCLDTCFNNEFYNELRSIRDRVDLEIETLESNTHCINEGLL
ncbi:MAG: hypothetical protein Unbinned8472contig1000_54 [Prokaryotic dsDNA virus sp.]|nr:MAG: hypothetical protein Unbinned8472contig1000_54 [Prokaryotic dsDNA virus sp.]|tara:strand:+ start:51942 stop:52142 length:201 start_codon:yes stop_codon:yes gene_type:complete